MIYIKGMGVRNDLFIPYPNGEFGINLNCIKDSYLANNNKLEIQVEFNDSYYCEDLIKLMMIIDRVSLLENNEHFNALSTLDKNIVRCSDYLSVSRGDISIKFNYLPFSREDREENGRLCTFDFVVRMLGLHRITWTVDYLHSNKVIESPVNINLFPIEDYDIIIFPDKGSYEKYSPYMPKDKDIIVFNKTRDKDTGKLLESHLISSNIPKEFQNRNLKCLIIDDICSYGNTFRMIPKNPNWSYHLFTVYNEGQVEELEGIDKIIYKNKIDFRKLTNY
jgi:phosphoribosylpyrophosphate synthetase